MIVRFDLKNLDTLCCGCHLYVWHGDKTETIMREEWKKRFPARFKYLINKLKNIPLSFQADTFWLKKEKERLEKILNTYDN